MAVTLMCPNLKCRKILSVPSSVRGSRVRCSYCGTMLAVPGVRGMGRKTKKTPEKESISVGKESPNPAGPGAK